MADWVAISSLATAGGTRALAGATFSAVRSSNRSARIAEQALREQRRPLLMHARLDDPAGAAGCSRSRSRLLVMSVLRDAGRTQST